LISDFFPAVVYVYDTQAGNLSYVSKRITDLLGYSLDDVKSWGKDWMKTIFHDDVDIAMKELEVYNALENAHTHTFNSRYRNKGDNWRYFRTQGSILKRDEAGKPLSILFIAQDVTEQLQSELELTRSNRDLEEFAYEASHDLQEPLRKVITFGERLRDKFGNILGNEGKAYLSRMAAATDNMRILIDNLLEFSKISRSNEAFVLSDLNVVMEEAKGELELKIEETGAEIMQDDLPFIVCNPLQIRQLFVNLLSNSLKFRKKDRKTIIRIGSRPATVEEKAAEKLPVDQVYYWITIADNGIGFEKEYAERIFLIFQRLHGKSEYPGSGIGLAICKKIADQHHGVIRAEGRPGDGAVFIVILPKGTRD